MRRRRNGAIRGATAGDIQSARSTAIEWRKRLRVDAQYRPDIGLIISLPKTVFPNIKVRTFPASAYRKQRVRGWANTRTRTINIADDVQTGLKYGDPKSRWDAAHELAHIALGHPGNNLLQGKPYLLAEDSKFEEQVDAFVFEFLSPFHLAKNLSSVEEYERRFGIPRDKAIIRKHQIDELKRQAITLPGRGTPQSLEQMNWQSHTRSRRNAPRRATPSIVPEQFFLPFPQLSTQATSSPIGGANVLENATCDIIARSLPEGKSDFAICQIDLGSNAISEDQELLGVLIRDTNRRIRRLRRSIKLSIGTLISLIGGLPLLTESMDGKIKIGALVASGLIGAALSFLQILDRPIGLESRFEALAWKVLKSLAEKRGITRKLARSSIFYHQNRFVLRKENVQHA